jgi:hypothetical protein
MESTIASTDSPTGFAGVHPVKLAPDAEPCAPAVKVRPVEEEDRDAQDVTA